MGPSRFFKDKLQWVVLHLDATFLNTINNFIGGQIASSMFYSIDLPIHPKIRH